MSESPKVWHYGLMAEYWALFKRDAPELPGLLALIERFGQPVLDLGCGAGRILMPLLASGVDVDGIDVSADMIGHARRAAEQRGYAPSLLAQPMSGLSPCRMYRTILIVDSFGLEGDRARDLAALRGCHAALVPGGALALNIQAEYTSANAWAMWSADGRKRLPEPWPDQAIERVAPNGDLFRLRIRSLWASPLTQSYKREMRIERWVDGALAAHESATLTDNMYFPAEVALMLHEAGFAHVELFDGFSRVPANDASEEVLLVAHRR